MFHFLTVCIAEVFYIQYLIVFKCDLFIYYHLFLVKLYYFMY